MPRNHVDGGLLTQPPCPIYLGIDPSLTGYALTAIADNSDHFESWVYTSPNKGVERLIDIQQWLIGKIDALDAAKHRIKDVAMESGVFHSQSAAVLGEVAAITKITLHDDMAVLRNPLQVPPTSVKKFATDKGNAKKNEVMLAIYKKWGVEFPDDNMADSYVIARIARQRFATAYEQDVLNKLQDPKFRDPARV